MEIWDGDESVGVLSVFSFAFGATNFEPILAGFM